MKKFILPLICLVMTNTLWSIEAAYAVCTAGRVVSALVGFATYANDTRLYKEKEFYLLPARNLACAVTCGFMIGICFDTFPISLPMYCGGLMVASAVGAGAGLGYGANLLAKSKNKTTKKVVDPITKGMGWAFGSLSLYAGAGLFLLWLGSRTAQK